MKTAVNLKKGTHHLTQTTLLLVGLLLSVSSAVAQGQMAEALEVGDIVTVPAWKWVTVENQESLSQTFKKYDFENLENPPSNTTRKISAGDTCGIEIGGTLEILRISADDTFALVRYSAPGNPAGTPCPTGVMAILKMDELTQYDNRFAALQEDIQGTKEAVGKILAGKGRKATTSMKAGDSVKVPSWRWIDLVNQAPIQQRFSNGTSMIGFGDRCGIEVGGTLEVIGFSDDGNSAVVRYSAPGRPMGTPCPDGVLTVFNVAKLSSLDEATR